MAHPPCSTPAVDYSLGEEWCRDSPGFLVPVRFVGSSVPIHHTQALAESHAAFRPAPGTSRPRVAPCRASPTAAHSAISKALTRQPPNASKARCDGDAHEARPSQEDSGTLAWEPVRPCCGPRMSPVPSGWLSG